MYQMGSVVPSIVKKRFFRPNPYELERAMFFIGEKKSKKFLGFAKVQKSQVHCALANDAVWSRSLTEFTLPYRRVRNFNVSFRGLPRNLSLVEVSYTKLHHHCTLQRLS